MTTSGTHGRGLPPKTSESTVDVMTRDGPLRLPRSLLFTTWSEAPEYCSNVGGRSTVSCFRSFPTFPVEAALTARTKGDTALFWLMLRRLDAAHEALHSASCPSPTSDTEGYARQLQEYGSIFVSTLFLLAACHRFGLSWNEDIIVDKCASQLSLRTLPLLYDATARFRHDSGASTQRLLAACHDMCEKEAWRYDVATQSHLEETDRIYAERTAAAVSAGAAPPVRSPPVPSGDVTSVIGATTVAEDDAEAATIRALEAQLRSVERDIEAQRLRNESAFATALEQRLAEAENTLAVAHNKVSAMEASKRAAWDVVLLGTSPSASLVTPDKEGDAMFTSTADGTADPVLAGAGPAVYAAAMAAAKEDLARYLAEMRAALPLSMDLQTLTQRANAVFELAADREESHRTEAQQRLQSLAALSNERARNIAAARHRIAQALERMEGDAGEETDRG